MLAWEYKNPSPPPFSLSSLRVRPLLGPSFLIFQRPSGEEKRRQTNGARVPIIPIEKTRREDRSGRDCRAEETQDWLYARRRGVKERESSFARSSLVSPVFPLFAHSLSPSLHMYVTRRTEKSPMPAGRDAGTFSPCKNESVCLSF